MHRRKKRNRWKAQGIQNFKVKPPLHIYNQITGNKTVIIESTGSVIPRLTYLETIDQIRRELAELRLEIKLLRESLEGLLCKISRK